MKDFAARYNQKTNCLSALVCIARSVGWSFNNLQRSDITKVINQPLYVCVGEAVW